MRIDWMICLGYALKLTSAILVIAGITAISSCSSIPSSVSAAQKGAGVMAERIHCLNVAEHEYDNPMMHRDCH